ncbi:MAG TPA: double-strand break repair protein AddB [Caulobacteraceae bacterium]|nr:double-strand break repair protein AddB [Caulobacteraceae bacterium]
MSLFAAPAPRWLTIDAQRPFLPRLADALLDTLGPEALGDAIVFLPTRRAGRVLAERLVAAAPGGALLLPQIRALGDLAESEPPFEPAEIAAALPAGIGPRARRFELAGLVARGEDLIGRRLSAPAALELGDALGRFFEGCQIEEVDPAGAADLATGAAARHFDLSAKFLAFAAGAWRERLAALGLMDIAERRVALLRRLADRWRCAPPEAPVIAAGSTGATAAVADLLIAIAAAPQGCVVLPGLDLALPERAWSEVGEEHPQGALRRLIARAGIERSDVRTLGAGEGGAGGWRARVIGEALAPAAATADWLEAIGRLRTEDAGAIGKGLAGLSLYRAHDEEDQARIAALLLREALETPERTCALISPDAALARRVSAALTRWGIEAESSAGRPLADAPAAHLAALLARTAIDPTDPALLLAILKHPLTRLSMSSRGLAARRRTLERWALRGSRARDWESLELRLAAAQEALLQGGGPEDSARRGRTLPGARDLLGRLGVILESARAPFATGVATAAAATEGLVRAIEQAVAEDEGGGSGLWSGPAGERLAALFSDLHTESGALPPLTVQGFADLLATLLESEALAPEGAGHPRLQILGVLEGRLQSADLVVLAGLEEGVWPAAPAPDPFLTRAMRSEIGLPPPERRIGLSAHDFAQAAAAPDVVLIQAERRGGAPSVPSRWLWRLETLARGAQVAAPTRPEIPAWARALDAPLAEPPAHLKPARCPRPAPPLALRPRRLSVTAVETWIRDPYATYARHVLRLRPLERPGETVGARERGSAIHRAFERFARTCPEDLGENAEAEFGSILLEELRAAGMIEGELAWEAARAADIARWAVAFERSRRPLSELLLEESGELAIATTHGTFVLTARADRIEVRDVSADIIDLKTGAPPSQSQVEAGLAPQLPLSAAILAGGGFGRAGKREPGELLYLRIKGGREGGRRESRGAPGKSAALAAAALAGLKRRIAHFDRPETPYRSWAIPEFSRFAGDYDHLARVWEWKVMGEADA